MSRYDGLAQEYADFLDAQAQYYAHAGKLLRRLLGPGAGRCIDLGCGTGRFLAVAADLGWDVCGVDVSADQLRLARRAVPTAQLVEADASKVPLADGSFDAGFSTFTHTDVDDFAGLVAEARRLLRPGARFVCVGNPSMLCRAGTGTHTCAARPSSRLPARRPLGRRIGARLDARRMEGTPRLLRSPAARPVPERLRGTDTRVCRRGG